MSTLLITLALAFGLDVHTIPSATRIVFQDCVHHTSVDIIVFKDNSYVILADVPGYTREYSNVLVSRHGTSLQFFEDERSIEPFLVLFPGGYVLDIKPETD
mgnify:CR=1 FL=1